MLRRLSTYLYLRPKLVLWLLLGPPMLYMLVVYLGSLFSLLLNSFFYLDGFTGKVVYQFTLQNYFKLFERANLEIFTRTTLMAAAVTLADAALAFPLGYYMAKFASPRVKSFMYLAVLVPLWSSYLVRVYAWRLILAREGILTWMLGHIGLRGALDWLLTLPYIGGPSLGLSSVGMFLALPTSGCRTWSCRSRPRLSGCRVRSKRPPATWARGRSRPSARSSCRWPSRVWWQARSLPSR